MTDLKGRTLQAVPLLVLLLLWQWVASSNPESAFFFGSPLAIVQRAATMIANDLAVARALLAGSDTPWEGGEGLLWNMVITGGEALAGFVIGNLLGACVGIGLWIDRRAAFLARPYLIALGSIPIFAIAPLTILWFGIGIMAKVWLAVLSTFFIAAAQAFKAMEEVDPLFLQRLRLMGARRSVIFRRLLVPASFVWVIAALRLTVGASLLGAFLGELIAADQGLGRLIVRASGLYDTPQVMVGVLAIIAIAMGLDAIVSRIEKRLLRWRR
jgi:NitT/TauT family transport system permease protein